jgi:hypothetical protein
LWTETPELLGGWGSIEQPNLRAQLYSTDVEAKALLISSHRVSGGIAFGYLSSSHYVLNVLFVRKTKDDQYERVGVGRIFDKDLVRTFMVVENETVYLV